MGTNSIHPDTRLTRLQLNVSDLERSIAFYRQALGLQLLHQEDHNARLGAGTHDFLWLEGGHTRPRNPRETGLYHFAILVPSRPALAKWLRHMAETQTPIQGMADHLVSEAVYLSDPDDNGIEVYRDRPRAEWPTEASGKLRMATDPLDVEGLMVELSRQPTEWQGMDPQTRLGHIHLQVSFIPASEDFYCNVLGFDLVTRYGPAASFVSAGGYHHHIGMNTWAGEGAPPPPAESVGLRNFVIQLPNAQELERIASRVKQAGIALDETPEGLALSDPSHNRILLTAAR